MARLKITVTRLPVDAQQVDLLIEGLTDTQAERAAPAVRYWESKDNDLFAVAVPIIGE